MVLSLAWPQRDGHHHATTKLKTQIAGMFQDKNKH